MAISSSVTKPLAIIAASAALAASLAACSSDKENADNTQNASSDNPVTIKLGTTDVGGTVWPIFIDEAKKQGINVDLVQFSDYTTPNKALAEKQIDANKFQHLKFLSQYNVGAGDNLVPVGATEIVPLALFWKGHDSIDGIEGKEVAIPNDASNQGRAINVLAQAKLLKLKTPGLLNPTPADIDQASSKVKVVPVEATQTTAAYGEGKPAIINNTFLGRANIDPQTAVFADDPAAPEAAPYINAFVTRPEDAKNPNILKLVEIWHLPDVQAANEADSKGTSVSVTRSGEELQKILKDLQDKQSQQG